MRSRNVARPVDESHNQHGARAKTNQPTAARVGGPLRATSKLGCFILKAVAVVAWILFLLDFVGKQSTTTLPYREEEDSQPGLRIPTHSFHFGGRLFLDAIITTVRPDGKNGDSNMLLDDAKANVALLIILTNEQLKDPPPGGSAVCRFSSSQATTNLTIYDWGGLAYVCPVPVEEMVAIDEQATVQVRLEAASGENVNVVASTWPWQDRAKHFAVTNANMVKNIKCGRHLDQQHCFHDWILWHRMQGIEHFFIYDNNSVRNHPWLRAARLHIQQGVITLIDWPGHLGGSDNNQAQRVQMNHAQFAFLHRVQWLGNFDVDEFLVRAPSLETGDQEEQSVFDMLQGILILNNRTRRHTAVQIETRLGQSPDSCRMQQQKGFVTTGTTRLSCCDLYDSLPFHYRHSKVFLRGQPQWRLNPHPGEIKTAKLHFLHFAKKYACGQTIWMKEYWYAKISNAYLRFNKRWGHIHEPVCVKDTSFANSSQVALLEKRLTLLDGDAIQACAKETRPGALDANCY